jgi:hypothetical protein
MEKDYRIRLKEETIKILKEVDRLRSKEGTRTKEIYAQLMKDARGMWTPNQSVLFLANFYLKHRNKKR